MAPCSLCGSSDLVAYHDRRDAACASCGALERQRALARELTDALTPRSSRRCLEVAPLNPFVFGGFLRGRGWHYEGVDKRLLRESSDPGAFETFIDHDMDLTDLRGIETARYELIILQHVLEEIRDYRAALDELSRVLEPGGRAVLEIPWKPARPETRHKPPDRYDNCWDFGADLLDDLRARFGAVAVTALAEGAYKGDVFVCRAA